ncbi:unnamed protein product [Penicillium nalgiovense]|nr:unnamed protein product [Penicillium nalgiovense]
MTDLTPTLNNLLSKQGSSIPQTRKPCTETADEFLKEAYRISLRQETSSTLLHKKYGHSAAGALLWRWAGGNGALDNADESKSAEQVHAEELARSTATVRESVLWFLRRGLECAVSVQRRMVEKRIERVREKEKSVLYKVGAGKPAGGAARKGSVSVSERTGASVGPVAGFDAFQAPEAAVLSEADTARIEAQLSPEQLQLFAEENDSMLRHYEDTLGKKRREISPGDLLFAGNACLPPRYAGGIYFPACLGRGYDADECRAGKSGAEACYGATECGAGCLLGDCRVVYLACGLGFGLLVPILLHVLTQKLSWKPFYTIPDTIMPISLECSILSLEQK